MNQKKIIWIGGVIVYTLLVALICKHLFYGGDRGPASKSGWDDQSSRFYYSVYTKVIHYDGIRCVLMVGDKKGGIDCDFKRIDP